MSRLFIKSSDDQGNLLNFDSLLVSREWLVLIQTIRSYQGSMWWHIQPDWWLEATSKKKDPLLCTGKKSKILSGSVWKNNTIVKNRQETRQINLLYITYIIILVMHYLKAWRHNFIFSSSGSKSIGINKNLNPDTELEAVK